MFANRRKRAEIGKTLYFKNRLNEHFSPNPQGFSEELHDEGQWTYRGGRTHIYNDNSGNVAINMNTQPLTALDVSGVINTNTKYTINYIAIAPPVGSIMAYTVASSPDGWLLCNGAEISRSDFSGLFGVLGTTFGIGNNTTTFNLPDYRGAFLRGTGTHGSYIGPSLNTSQNHATQTHSHTATSVVTDPGHAHNYTDRYFAENYSGGQNNLFGTGAGTDNDNSYYSTTGTSASATTGITVATTIANSTTSVDANETRPYNYGVWWIIKY